MNIEGNFGLKILNAQGIPIFTNNAVCGVIKGLAVSGTQFPYANNIAVRPINDNAYIYKYPRGLDAIGPHASEIRTSDGQPFEYIILQPYTKIPESFSYGLTIKNNSEYLVFDSNMDFGVIAFNGILKYNSTLDLSLIPSRVGAHYYVMISSMNTRTYNATLNNGLNWIMMTFNFDFENSVCHLGGKTITTASGVVSGQNYTRTNTHNVIIIQA